MNWSRPNHPDFSEKAVQRESALSARIDELESTQSLKLNDCCAQIRQTAYRESEFCDRILKLETESQSLSENMQKLSGELPRRISKDTENVTQLLVSDARTEFSAISLKLSDEIEKHQKHVNERLLAVEDALRNRKKKRAAKKRSKTRSPLPTINHKPDNADPHIVRVADERSAFDDMDRRISMMEKEVLDVASAVETYHDTIVDSTKIVYELQSRDSATKDQINQLECSVGVIQHQLCCIPEEYATKIELYATISGTCENLNKDDHNSELFEKSNKKEQENNAINHSHKHLSEKPVTRGDVSVMLEEHRRSWDQQLTGLANSMATMEDTVQLIGTALTGVHNTMAHQNQIESMHSSLKSIQISVEEVREWFEKQLKKNSSEHTANYSRIKDEASRLNDLAMVIRRETSSHAAELQSQYEKMKTQVQEKVDSNTFTKLVYQSATREEMKKYVEKKIKQLVTPPRDQQKDTQMAEKLDDLKRSVSNQRAELETIHTKIGKLGPRVEANQSAVTKIEDRLHGASTSQMKPKRPIQTLNEGDTTTSSVEAWSNGRNEEYDIIHHKLTSLMDEKLYMVASEISTLRASLAVFKAHPLLRGGVWIWRSGHLKHGSGIPWTVEAQNTDIENLRWEPDSCIVRVAEQGVYELSFSFYTRLKPSIQVIVNGESVMSAIHSPTYTVHHGSGTIIDGHGRERPGTVTGISLSDFLNLPSKSTLCLHWHGKLDHAVEGFMALRRLN